MENQNNKLVDKWTAVHIATGLLIGSTIKERKIAYPIIIGFEIIEKLFLEEIIFKEIEGVNNIISDLLFGVGSFEIAREFSS